MYCGDGIIVEGQDWQWSRVMGKYLSCRRCYVLDVAVAEGRANYNFWWEVLHDAEIKGDDEIVETEIETKLPEWSYAGVRSAA